MKSDRSDVERAADAIRVGGPAPVTRPQPGVDHCAGGIRTESMR